MFSITREEALKELRSVVRTVDSWKQHFKDCGVTRGDIESYAEQIDRTFLQDQRAQFRGRRHK